MRHTTIAKQTLAVVLAAGAFTAASPALARPIDRVEPAVHGSIAYDTWRAEQVRSPGHPSQTTPKPAPIVATAPPDSGGDDVWLIVGTALAATGLAAASSAAVARRHRLRARRVSV